MQESHSFKQPLLYMLSGAVVTLLLILATTSLGAPGMMLNLFVAVPAAYVHMRFGSSIAAGSVLLIATGVFLLGGLTGTIGYLVQFGLLTVLLPALLRMGWNWDRATTVCVAIFVAAIALVLAGYAFYGNVGISELIDGFADSEVEQALALSTQAEELSAEQLQELRTLFEEVGVFLRYAYPGLVIGLGGLLSLLLLLFLAILGRQDYSIPGTPFAAWKAPEFLIWPLIAAGFASFFTEGVFRQISVNLLIVLVPVYFLQGLAVVTHYFNRRQLSPFLRTFGYMLIAILNPLPLIVTGIGVFDLWVDFRKPRIKRT